ncbi:phospholipase A2 inhibitor and Ly6/PLAUR domain-containing protein-like isoform X3 [Erpetoichthys calabaricus]|uniref:phospholipase A2 inhibitor and Ly6/PLAUR domain-containing protein-like isoform X3 n=1 Tax=Erpetoichthys calabaricus TaxID=27687 RepID=UPI002233EC66|nr:phospholipase A2 inhibitor and Ly6/PLAUR domain-containing protein-like isoform X3 [Erpetoichthys calabaricus]
MELFLVSLLFSLVCTVSSLTCHQCTPGTSLRCTETQKTCSPQETTCANAAVTTFVGGQSINVNAKDCATSSDGCGEVVSVNFLVSRVTVNVQCCNTDNCNTVSPPAYTDNNPNGLKCCVDENCQTTVQCLGKEDTCISAVVQIGGVTEMVRGCTSSNVCTTSQSSQIPGITQVNCCVGNLCNHAKRITLDILLALLPIVVLKFIF